MCLGRRNDCSLACCTYLSQECHDGIYSDFNLNCIEHQFSGWSCRPCVDCDGTECGEYWSNQKGSFPLYAFATLGDGQCDSGQESDDKDFKGGKKWRNDDLELNENNEVPYHLNWNCEEFKFDLCVLLVCLVIYFMVIMPSNGALFLVRTGCKALIRKPTFCYST